MTNYFSNASLHQPQNIIREKMAKRLLEGRWSNGKVRESLSRHTAHCRRQHVQKCKGPNISTVWPQGIPIFDQAVNTQQCRSML